MLPPREAAVPAYQALQLGFAAVDETEIARGVRELAVALEKEAAP